MPGMKDSVFQRVWSGRVVTKRKAWELLSLVDQIHSWGVTEHRDFVIKHMEAWHAFGRMCYANEFEFLGQQLGTDWFKKWWEEHSKSIILGPMASLQLAGWVESLTADAQDKLRSRSVFQFWEAHQRDADPNTDGEL
ncbi:hypothetical protein N7509_000539 [Penicillium cosmopolitanum]|uniref:Uncharacterized protein n=1 Tax=Penicillium cosmopolitanum TaxID=1131564 RepID=A0A9X0BE68_9EURO|nr:uncharacterized protein N7509_000539 [Penicillium cosmopolitanum]KAJ5413912.1 hypothetical protein N7509_000539 [Penicillium cosmopolitanum]